MSHITKEQRYTIRKMLQSGFNQSEIARVINKDKSVVSRELRRNADARSGVYRILFYPPTAIFAVSFHKYGGIDSLNSQVILMGFEP